MKSDAAKTEPTVVVLDAGGQYVDLVRRACERIGYPTVVLPLNTPAQELKSKYKAIIISGSPASSQEINAPMPDPEVWNLNIPILGICYGLHAMVTNFGGEIIRGNSRQDGRATTIVDNKHPLFKNTKTNFSALFTHGNFVSKVPTGFETLGKHKLPDGTTVYSSIAKNNLLAVQFHPEVFDDTPEGYQVFKNFLHDISGIEPNKQFLEQQTDTLVANLRRKINSTAKNRHVIAFVSGGVDSSVTATLAATEIPENYLHAYYIDNGLMRNEDDKVIEILRHTGVKVNKIDSSKEFLEPLENVIDPQTKRQIIGKVFVEVQGKIISELGLDEALLLQGTNAADRIESGYSKAGNETAVIKTHHNQVKEIQDLKSRGLLIEPLDDLFKDEVRAVGKHLGLPDEVTQRQPFPGPGLAVRILCATGKESIADITAVENQIKSHINVEDAVVKILPIRNVGVGGDERSHKAAVALQINTTWENLANLATELPAKFSNDINRVIVALGKQSIANFTVTPTFINKDTVAQLQHADKIVWEEMRAFGISNTISQFPVVLLPLSFDSPGERTIVLRPVTTSTFMTVRPMIPGKDIPIDFIQKTTERILDEVPGISQVFIDLTPKPPATTEWE